MKRFRLFPLIAAAVMLWCPVLCRSEAEPAIELREKEWTWEGENLASFEGKASLEGLPDGKLLLRLSIDTEPKATNPGEIVFQAVDEKKLTLRKQKEEYLFSREGQDELTFTGNWKTPDDVFFTKVNITFRICTEDGETVLAEQKMTVSRTTEEMLNIEDGKIRLKTDFSAWILWGSVAAGVIWILAVIRIVMNRTARKKER